jgi:GAF domain-containing protein/biotin carboxyl carrier protein
VPAVSDDEVALRLRAVASFARELAAAGPGPEFEETALGGAFTRLATDAGSFWRGTAAALTCHLAAGADADRLVGKVLSAAAVVAPDPRGRALAVLLDAGDGVVGAMRVSREGDAAAPFTGADLAMLEALGATTAAALAQASRVVVADRSADLALVARLGREIVSTLDLDRVLGIAVNLAAQAVPCDRGAIALYEEGECDVRAVAGLATLDREQPELKDLAARGAWAAGMGEAFYLSDRDDPGSDAERIFLQVFGADLEVANVGSALYLPLRDDEGVLGVLMLEATRAEFADPRQRELAAILASQATVAIRNAKLYAQVPLAEALSAFNVKRRAIFAEPSRRQAAWLGAAALLLGLGTLVQWPLRVAAEEARLLPLEGREARALVGGVVEQVLVAEGQRVARGTPIARLRANELYSRREAAVAGAEADEREAAMAASMGDAAAERVLRARAASRRREASLADEQLRFAVVRAPVDGTVLTPHPERRIGARVEAGDAVLLVGRTDSLELEFHVEEREVVRVREGQRVRLRVDAVPQRTFEARLHVLGRVPADSVRGQVRFAARALVANPAGDLRAGMAAHARVLTDPASLATRVLRSPVRALRLFWWRMWA